MRHIPVFFLLMALFIAPAYADDLTAIIQKHYAGMKSFSADFDQTLTHKESGSRDKRQGTILFAKPLRIHWHTKTPKAEYLIITQQSIWNYIPDESIAYRYNPNLVQGAANIIQVITGQADLMRDFDVKRVGMENNLQRLKLYPKNPTTQLVEADIWVDPITGVIRKTESTDFYGNRNAIRFTAYKENISVKESLFAFKPPKGVEVEDRRKDTEDKDLLR
ncbi:MAG: outer membrane lipoprotein chaperone LolA [Desulfovibrionaceae bacterium]|nr:outer membrane lipoprotein chaperone LolA [Desulfovibrionaceae bacterium]